MKLSAKVNLLRTLGVSCADMAVASDLSIQDIEDVSHGESQLKDYELCGLEMYVDQVQCELAEFIGERLHIC